MDVEAGQRARFLDQVEARPVGVLYMRDEAGEVCAIVGARLAISDAEFKQVSFVNSICTFRGGTHVAMQTTTGIQIWDVSNPAKPSMVSVVPCITSQGDPSIYGNLLSGSGVRRIDGFARLTGAHSVSVATLQADGSATHREFTAAHILIATGGTPFVPHFQGREHVITSNEVFDLEPFPQRLLVVGGGYIACEFASIFNGLGARVTQLYRGEQVLRGFDDEIRHFVAGEMQKAGVDLRLNAGVVDIRKTAEGLRAELEDGNVVMADAVLYATGRQPNVQGLGLEAVGVAQGAQGEVLVNEQYRTSVPHIFAVGDVTNRVQLTPVALGEAMVVVDQILGAAPGKAPRSMSYEFIPTAVFTHPNIGTVGYTEAQARERFGAITVFRSEFKSLKHTLSGSSERTLMKLIVDSASDRVVGLHMVGAEAGEIVQGFAVALKAGATKAVFDSTIGIHPTAAEEFVTMREPVRR